MFLAKNLKQNGTFSLFIAILLLFNGCAETLPIPPGGDRNSSFDQSIYDTADPLRGGRLYDSWWKAKRIQKP